MERQEGNFSRLRVTCPEEEEEAAWQVVSDRREDYEKVIPEKVLRL